MEDPTNQSLLYVRNRIRMSLRDSSSCEFYFTSHGVTETFRLGGRKFFYFISALHRFLISNIM